MQRARLVLSACLVIAVGPACSSDDLNFAEASTTTGAPTTGVPTTGEPEPDSSSGGSSTTTGDPTTGAPSSPTETTGEPEPGQTCSDVLMCLPECLASMDPACLGMCTENLPADEAMKAIQLGLCIGQGCFEAGACSLDMIQDPKCLACLGFGLLTQTSPGCEDQADACKGD